MFGEQIAALVALKSGIEKQCIDREASLFVVVGRDFKANTPTFYVLG